MDKNLRVNRLFRILGGIYLLYLSISLWRVIDTSGNKIVGIVFIIIFAATGVPLIILSTRDLIRMKKEGIDETEVTEDETGVTEDKTEVTEDKAEVTEDKTEVTEGKMEVTEDKTEITKNKTDEPIDEIIEERDDIEDLVSDSSESYDDAEVISDNELNHENDILDDGVGDSSDSNVIDNIKAHTQD